MKSEAPKPPHPGALMETIRKLAARGAYKFSVHALDERMIERGFDFEDVLKVIQQGDIDGKIVLGKHEGEWRCRVRGKLAWMPREAGVVTVVVREQHLVFVTVKWMDR